MLITRRVVLGSVSASLATGTFRVAAQAQTTPTEVELLIQQRAGLAPSPNDARTTVDFDTLAETQPQLRLDTCRKSVGLLVASPKNILDVFINSIQNRPYAHAGTVTILSTRVVALAAHEVWKNAKYTVGFSPFRGKDCATTIDIDPTNIDQDLDLAFGTFSDPDFVERNQLRPITWGSWVDAARLRKPVAVLGFKPAEHLRLHASLGSPANYFPYMAAKDEEGTERAYNCKGYITNAAYRGQSGGVATTDGNMIGLVTAVLDRTGLQSGCYVTPSEAIAVPFSQWFPAEAKQIKLVVPQNISNAFYVARPECRAFAQPN